jgi:hypothetical protein
MDEEQITSRGVRRIELSTRAIAAGGTIGFWAWHGWTWGVGFALGAFGSWLNLRLWRRVVGALGEQVRPRPAWRSIVRYLLMAALVYVIFRYSPISVAAALAGLFVAVAAVLLEILFELVYARN